MRIPLALAVMIAASGAAAQDANCLTPGEQRETLSQNRVVAPVVAIRAARRAAPDAEVVRARLCAHDNQLVYVIVALNPDGKVVRVTVDGASGIVSALR